MAIFKKTAEVKKDEMIKRLCAKCIISGDELVAARLEILDMANKAIDEYLSAAQKYRDAIQAEVDKRVERWEALEAQKAEIMQKVRAAEVKLGAALTGGKAADVDAAEAEISQLHAEIDKVDNRIRIFKNATFSLSGAEGIKAVEAKAAAMWETIRICDEIMHEVNKTVSEHVHDLRDKMGMFSSGSASIAGSFQPQVNIDFPAEFKLETLQRMASDDLTIEDLLRM